MVGELSIEKQIEDLSEEDMGRVVMFTMVVGLVIMLLVFRAVAASFIPWSCSWELSSSPWGSLSC